MINREQRHLRCPACLNISSGFSPDLSNRQIPCPKCGDKDNARELWPRYDILSVIDDWDLSKMDSEDSLPIKAILYCSAFDFLLEEFLSEVFHKIKTPPNVLEICLKANSNFGERVDLFHQLIGTKLKDFLKERGFTEFGEKFRILREKRNYFVHRTFEHDFSNMKDAFRIIEKDMLAVFVMLNNDFLALQQPAIK